MTLSLMIYGIVLGTFLAGAAFFLDRGFRALGRPTRWVWLAGMAAVAGGPFLPRFLEQAPALPLQQTTLPGGVLYDLLASATKETQTASALTLDRSLILLWALSSALILLLLVWTSMRLRRATKGWEKTRVGTEEILVSEGMGPAVLGLIRPRIVLPPWAMGLGKEELEIVLLHEKEHRDARDPALLATGLLLAAITPWNPGIWWMARRLHLAVEGDCDQRVIARGISPRRYGKLLLEVASGARGCPSLAPALAEGGQTFLERRLLMIRSTVRKHRLGVAALAILASAGLLILACETPTPPAEGEVEVVLSPAPSSVEMEATQEALKEAGEGYYLVRKTGGKVEYVESVSPDQLEAIQEGATDKPSGFRFRATGDPEGETKGTITLREGVSSIRVPGVTGIPEEGPQPLIYLDGVLVTDRNAISDLSPDLIEQIEVIKGPAAEALYGEKAASGVIKITTKG